MLHDTLVAITGTTYLLPCHPVHVSTIHFIKELSYNICIWNIKIISPWALIQYKDVVLPE